jgi:hypothetical protein
MTRLLAALQRVCFTAKGGCTGQKARSDGGMAGDLGMPDAELRLLAQPSWALGLSG